MRRDNPNNPKKTVVLLNFFYKYWLTFALLMALLTLFRQNFIINQFPVSLTQKQQVIDENIRINQRLRQKNQTLTLKLETESSQEILESNARFRFGLVKPNEIYYQIRHNSNNSNRH